MSDIAKRNRGATYDQIRNLPENLVGEIVDGELYVSPRPSPQHAFASANLTGKLIPTFGGGGTPGGWIILAEPELHLGEDEHDKVLVPDLAGWKKDRLPSLPVEPFISVVPNWVCEILSPSNMRLDRTKKVPQYAALGVEHLWLINPRDQTLEAFRLEGGKWMVLSQHVETDKVRVEPFEAMEFDLGALWG